MIKGATHAHLGPIWYHLEPSDVPYSPKQFLGWDFFCRFLQQDSSKSFDGFDDVCSLIIFWLDKNKVIFLKKKCEKIKILKNVTKIKIVIGI